MASWQVRVTVYQVVHNDKMPICIHIGIWFDESGSKNMLSKLSLLILKSCGNPIDYIVNWGELECSNLGWARYVCVCVCVIMSGVLDQIYDRLCLWKIIYLLTFGYEVVTCDPQKLPNSHRLHCQLGCVRVWQVSHRLHCQLGCVRAWQVDRLG